MIRRDHVARCRKSLGERQLGQKDFDLAQQNDRTPKLLLVESKFYEMVNVNGLLDCVGLWNGLEIVKNETIGFV